MLELMDWKERVYEKEEEDKWESIHTSTQTDESLE